MEPTNQPHGTNKHFYDRISGFYDSIANANEHTARELGEKLLALQPGESVLEVGYGTGNTVLNLAEKVGPQGKVSGIDVSDGMQTVAQAKVEEAGLSANVDLKVGDAISLDWPDETFDAVFLSFTLELFSELDAPTVLRECKRVLKASGRLGVVGMATVNQDEHESLLEKTYIWMHRHFPHIVDCRPIDFAAAVQEAGFTVAKEERIEIWTMPVAALVAKKVD
ncbi:methyltransferase domain-containing protein [Mariniblastus sp.]|nr:methyltransferase domain-containing protein [Mariniblastus sp.]